MRWILEYLICMNRQGMFAEAVKMEYASVESLN
jgi:hypothetical protein